MGGFSLFTDAPAAMSCQRWPVRGLGIYGCGCIFPSLLLDEKGPKNQGRHQGPTALGNHSSPMLARPARPTRSRFGVPAHGIRTENSTTTDNTPAPCRHRGHRPAISLTARGLPLVAHHRAKQPCHPCAGLCVGLGSMPAACHCHPSYYENPTLHIGV